MIDIQNEKIVRGLRIYFFTDEFSLKAGLLEPYLTVIIRRVQKNGNTETWTGECGLPWMEVTECRSEEWQQRFKIWPPIYRRLLICAFFLKLVNVSIKSPYINHHLLICIFFFKLVFLNVSIYSTYINHHHLPKFLLFPNTIIFVFFKPKRNTKYWIDSHTQ